MVPARRIIHPLLVCSTFVASRVCSGRRLEAANNGATRYAFHLCLARDGPIFQARFLGFFRLPQPYCILECSAGRVPIRWRTGRRRWFLQVEQVKWDEASPFFRPGPLQTCTAPVPAGNNHIFSSQGPGIEMAEASQHFFLNVKCLAQAEQLGGHSRFVRARFVRRFDFDCFVLSAGCGESVARSLCATWKPKLHVGNTGPSCSRWQI